jgi:hypothetical protein
MRGMISAAGANRACGSIGFDAHTGRGVDMPIPR